MPLPRKQTMNGNVVFLTTVMVSLSQFKKKCKGDLFLEFPQFGMAGKREDIHRRKNWEKGAKK